MAKRRTVRIAVGCLQITPCTLLCIFLFGYFLHFVGFFSPFWVVDGCHEHGLFYSCSDCMTVNHTSSPSSIRGCFIRDSSCKYICYLPYKHYDYVTTFKYVIETANCSPPFGFAMYIIKCTSTN